MQSGLCLCIWKVALSSMQFPRISVLLSLSTVPKGGGHLLFSPLISFRQLDSPLKPISQVSDLAGPIPGLHGCDVHPWLW